MSSTTPTMITRPMLAGTVRAEGLENLCYPILISPKLDGIRCLIHPDLGPVTRSFKPLPNAFVREELKRICTGSCWDGELVAVDEQGDPLDFNDTQSKLMTRDGAPTFKYFVFDCFGNPTATFKTRLDRAEIDIHDLKLGPQIQVVGHSMIYNAEDFVIYSQVHIQQGYEGTMIRDPEGPYKSGRSTLNQGWLLKFKEWCDAEGTIIGFEELYRNKNEDQRDNFGLAKRSSHITNMISAGTLGALVLDTEWGELRVGSGFDMALRDEIWRRNKLDENGGRCPPDVYCRDLGRRVTFKYQPFGMKEEGKPRFPIFMRFREDE